MKIGVLGAGRMAEALVPRWVGSGHEVVVGGRRADRAREVAERAGAAWATTLAEAARFGEATMLAVLYAGVDPTLQAAGDDGVLRGRVLIDITNTADRQTYLPRTPPGVSVAEQIAQRTGADVVKTLHQVHGAVFAERAHFAGAPLVVPMAGSERAKETASELIRDAGGVPLDAGDLTQARNLEAMAAIVIRQLFNGAPSLAAFQWTVGRAT